MLDPKRPVRGGLGLLSAPVLLLAGASSVALAASVAQDVPEVTAQDRPWEKDVTEKPRPKVQTDELTPAVASTESRWRAITAGLAYLEGAQSDDGGWWPGLIEIGADESVDGVARYKSVEWSGEFNRTGVTALAVLAFCEADQAQRPAVKKAIDYLLSVQGEEGCIGTRDQFLHIPSHLAATLAVLRYHESHPDEKLLACAQQGMGYIARSRNPYSGWRYSSPPDGDNDTFITSLALRALVAGRAAGLEVDEQAFVGGMSWIEEMTNFNTGRCGYNERGGPVSRLQITRESHPVEWTEMLTSMAILARLDMGQKPLQQKAIREGALLVANTPPLWDERRGSIDYYHWAFGTDALQRLGGFHYTHWLERLDTALIPHQEEDGSWRPIDAWSTNGARIHATAINTWTLAMSARK